MKMLRRATGLLAAEFVLGTSLAACAAAPPPLPLPLGQPMHLQRLIARSAAEWPTPLAFAARVEQVAGVPVRDVGVVAPRLYSFTLACVDAPDCRAAMQRLAAARDLVTEMQANERRTLTPTPSPPLAQ